MGQVVLLGLLVERNSLGEKPLEVFDSGGV